jgi:Tol biopolymer transport system component
MASGCGDGICSGAETCITCPVDCSATCTAPASCGEAGCAPPTGRIAFVSDRTGTKLIYVANADGSGVAPLTAGELPAWSADGLNIAFSSAGGIWVIDANGTNEPRFLRAGGSPTWSPDGAKIAYQGSDGIYVMNADSSDPRLLISNEFAAGGWGEYGVFSPAWSPDGQRIAFVRANYEEPFAIYTMLADGSGAPTAVPTGGWAQDTPAWLPDGRIGFATVGDWVDPNTNVLSSADQIASATASGSDLKVYVTSGTRGYVGDPTWSPDGRSLLFTANSSLGTPTRLYLVREDGSVAKAIPEAPSPANADYLDSEPAWSLGP